MERTLWFFWLKRFSQNLADFLTQKSSWHFLKVGNTVHRDFFSIVCPPSVRKSAIRIIGPQFIKTLDQIAIVSIKQAN